MIPVHQHGYAAARRDPAEVPLVDLALEFDRLRVIFEPDDQIRVAITSWSCQASFKKSLETGAAIYALDKGLAGTADTATAIEPVADDLPRDDDPRSFKIAAVNPLTDALASEGDQPCGEERQQGITGPRR
jgi:hypothetical protein